MKKILVLVFTFFYINGFSQMKKMQHNICKQKDIVLSGEYHEDGYIHLKSKNDLNNLKILKMYGIDGLNVKSYDPVDNIQLVMDDVLKIKIDLEAPKGLSYLNITYTYQGKKTGTVDNLIIAFGKISKEQKNHLDKSEVITKKYLPVKNPNSEVLEVVPNSSVRVKRIRNAIGTK